MSEGRVIQSVERALSILELFDTTSRDLSVTEISNRMGLSKSTAYGLINTLAQKGYLEQNPRDSRYSLGFRLLRLGRLVRKNNILCQRARPYMEQLVADFSETVHLAVERNGQVVYIEKLWGEKTIFMQSEVGGNNPMYCTAVGKCILAFMPLEQRERILANMGSFERRGPNTIMDMAALRKSLDEIRQRGIGFDDEESAPGLLCIGAPIYKKGCEIVAAISLSGAKAGISQSQVEEISARLSTAAEAISVGL